MERRQREEERRQREEALAEERHQREEALAVERRQREEEHREQEEALADECRQREEALAEERRQREEALAEERRRQEEQMHLLMRLVEGTTERLRVAETGPGAASPDEKVKLTRLTESDDVEAYLTTFERLMQAHGVDATRWAYKLAPQLTGRAQQAYAALPSEQAGSYEQLKTAILQRYDINAETYRQRFRAATRKANESHREFVVRLQDLQQKWTKECTTVDKLREVVVMEQFLNALRPDLRLWVKERSPKTVAEAGELADQHAQARKQTQDWNKPERRGPPEQLPVSQRKCHNCGQLGHYRKDCTKATGTTAQETRPKLEVKCYNCGRKGHIATRCPNNALLCMETTRRDGQASGVH